MRRGKKVYSLYRTVLFLLGLRLAFCPQAAAGELTSMQEETLTVTVFYDGTKAEELLSLLNGWRTGQDVPAVTADVALNAIAAKRASELFIRYSHVRPDESVVFEDPSAEYGVSAEIYGCGENPKEILDVWCRDNAAILTDASLCAAGCAVAAVGGKHTVVLLLSESAGSETHSAFADGSEAWTIDRKDCLESLSLILPEKLESLDIGESMAFEPILALNNGVFETVLSDCIPILTAENNAVYRLDQEMGRWLITCRSRGSAAVRGEYQGISLFAEVTFGAEEDLTEEETADAATEESSDGLTEWDFEQGILFIEETEEETEKNSRPKAVWQAGTVQEQTQMLTAVAVDQGVIDLSWPPMEADGYLIYGIRGGEEYKYIGLCEGAENTSYRDSEADAGRANQYWVYPYKHQNGRIVAGNAIGTVQASGQVLPAAVEGLQSRSTDKAVFLSWEAGDNPPDGWIIYRKSAGERTFICIGVVQEPAFEDRNAAAGWNQYRAAAYVEDFRGNRITGEAGPAVYGRKLEED